MLKKKLLLIRLDKIGDLICTMCVDQIKDVSELDVTWAISKGLGFIPENAEPKRQFIEIQKEFSKSNLFNLIKIIKVLNPEIAVSFQSPWWVNLALFIARVPKRVGVLSQWHSFLFLNKGLRQKRSQAIKHEADYNLELLQYALIQNKHKPAVSPTPILKLTAPSAQEEQIKFLNSVNLTSKEYFVVHPGMAGSALNWTLDRYLEYIQKISEQKTVVITGTTHDEKWFKPILESFKLNTQIMDLTTKLSADQLLIVLKHAHKVIAPSTGVLHIAAALGTPTFGIYSPIQVHHPRRWGARGEFARNFLPPEVVCPEKHYCALQKCEYYNCMKSIDLP